MKVILQQDIPNVGKKYDVKNVSDGYAMNFLIPRKCAVYATEESERNIERMRQEQAVAKQTRDEKQAAVVAGLDQKRIEIHAKASEGGSLFAGVPASVVAKALNKEFGLSLEESEIELSQPIKEVGEHAITVSALGVRAKVVVAIIAK